MHQSKPHKLGRWHDPTRTQPSMKLKQLLHLIQPWPHTPRVSTQCMRTLQLHTDQLERWDVRGNWLHIRKRLIQSKLKWLPYQPTYQLFDNLHDGITGTLGLVLITSDLNHIIGFSSISFLFWELDLHAEVLANLVDHSSLLPNNFGVVFGINVNNFLVAAQLLCRRGGEEGRGGEGSGGEGRGKWRGGEGKVEGRGWEGEVEGRWRASFPQ